LTDNKNDGGISDLERGKLIQKLDETQIDIHDLVEAVRRIDTLLRGNGAPGLVVRVDRLEQRFIVGGLVIIPAISAAVSWLVGHFFK